MSPIVTRFLPARRRRRIQASLLALALGEFARPVASPAQMLPSEPIRLAGGRVVIGGEVTAGISTVPDRGFFNYTDYAFNNLRLLRVAASADVRLAEQFAVLCEVRTENGGPLRAYALFLRVRPFRGRPFDIQAGRVPPVFGSFPRRSYAASNPLVGYPLAYQYLTSLRSDALPATTDDLLRMRGRGWLTQYPVGSPERAPGLPLVSAFRWDTGVEARIATTRVELAGAVTNGSLSNPLVRDDNGGKQVAGRGAVRPTFGLTVGASAARGAYLSRRVAERLPAPLRRHTAQTAFGVDGEYARGHWLLRAEWVLSRWQVPMPQDSRPEQTVRAHAAMVEGRYTLRAGWYVAARVDRLTFSALRGTRFDGGLVPWEAPVRRVEVATGWSLQRNLVVKLAVQRDWREGGYVRAQGFGAAQLVYWF